MRLINTTTLEFEQVLRHDTVKYAILSHRWEDEEVSFQDVTCRDVKLWKGYRRIISSCLEASRAGLQYIWIDTCCIDKSSSAELSEAINSMYQWYTDAEVCLAFLSDAESANDLEHSVWFSRGWTLQELIAPKKIRFYDKNWKCFGSKAGLQRRLSDLTGIPTRILRGDARPTEFSIAQRMSWAATRTTTRPEDQAYCLMGLFDVNMPLLYGEGAKAFIRLQEEIIKTSDDHTIFSWSSPMRGRRGIWAPSPAFFQACGDTISTAGSAIPEAYSVTNVGLSICLPLLPWTTDTYMAILQCRQSSSENEKMLMPRARQELQRLCLEFCYAKRIVMDNLSGSLWTDSTLIKLILRTIKTDRSRCSC